MKLIETPLVTGVIIAFSLLLELTATSQELGNPQKLDRSDLLVDLSKIQIPVLHSFSGMTSKYCLPKSAEDFVAAWNGDVQAEEYLAIKDFCEQNLKCEEVPMVLEKMKRLGYRSFPIKINGKTSQMCAIFVLNGKRQVIRWNNAVEQAR